MASGQGALGQQQESQVVDLLIQAKNLLEQQKAEEARGVLEKARALDGEHVAVRTLLALTYYKTGRLEQAENLYGELIDEVPMESALYVNLSMLYLQQQRVQAARKLLEKALEFSPADKKVHSSLGLVYARLEDYRKAHEHFETAGQAEMAARMARKFEEQPVLLAPIELSKPVAVPAIVVEDELAVGLDGSILPLQGAMTNPEQRAISSSDAFSASESDGAAPLLLLSNNEPEHSIRPTEPVKTFPVASVVEVQDESWPVVVLPPEQNSRGRRDTEPPPSEDVPFLLQDDASMGGFGDIFSPQQPTPPPAPADLADYDYSAIDEVLGLADTWWEVDEDAEPPTFWSREADVLEIYCESQVFSRLSGLISMTGSLETRWESKRFQGKPIEQIFGPPEDPMACIEGRGTLRLFVEKAKHLTMMQIADPLAAYFCEGSVLAFGPQISWENGRVPSPSNEVPDMPLDNLWGEGTVLVVSKAPLRGFHIKAGQRVRVAYDRLVGWVGALVPRIVHEKALALPDRPTVAFVEFEGEGGILVRKC